MTKREQYFDELAAEISIGSTVRDACKTTGCAESTGYRISNDPLFSLRVSEIRTRVTDAAVGRQSAAASSAVNVLREILENKASDPKDRIASAKAILSSLLNLTEMGEMRRRLDKLERREMRDEN